MPALRLSLYPPCLQWKNLPVFQRVLRFASSAELYSLLRNSGLRSLWTTCPPCKILFTQRSQSPQSSQRRKNTGIVIWREANREPSGVVSDETSLPNLQNAD